MLIYIYIYMIYFNIQRNCNVDIDPNLWMNNVRLPKAMRLASVPTICKELN